MNLQEITGVSRKLQEITGVFSLQLKFTGDYRNTGGLGGLVLKIQALGALHGPLLLKLQGASGRVTDQRFWINVKRGTELGRVVKLQHRQVTKGG